MGYLETDDFAEARRRMSLEPVNGVWQESMRELWMRRAAADKQMERLEEVFHLA